MLCSNMSYCVKLTCEDLLHYSNKIGSVGLRKCSHYHCLESNVTITNLLQSLPHIIAGKQLAQIWYEEIKHNWAKTKTTK